MGEGSSTSATPESTSFAPTTGGTGQADTGEPMLPADTVRVAVIGDYGLDGEPEAS